MDNRSAYRHFIVCCAVLAPCLYTPPVAQSQVVVRGADATSARNLQTWYDHHMPAPFRVHGHMTVNQFDDQQMDAYLKDGNPDDRSQFNSNGGDDSDTSDIDGVFDDDPARIALRVPASGETDLFTFAHEYGHYVWFDLMSKQDRQKYEVIYNRQHVAHHLVTHYAETNLEEGFAEAFSFYINEPPLLARRDSASYQFLTQWTDSSH